jgi:hypothetical protein
MAKEDLADATEEYKLKLFELVEELAEEIKLYLRKCPRCKTINPRPISESVYRIRSEVREQYTDWCTECGLHWNRSNTGFGWTQSHGHMEFKND